MKKRTKLDALTELVHTNIAKAQKQQKLWYDRSSRKRVVEPGQKVLLLLPKSDSGLIIGRDHTR